MNILALVLVVIPLAACQLIGGPMTVDVNRDDIQQMASFALTQLNTLLGSQNTLVSVVKAKTQVVSGINYILTLQIQNGQETQTCDVTIWNQSWTQTTQMTQHSCTRVSKRDILTPGGLTNVDINSPEVTDMANFALDEINGLQGAKNTMEEVISAKAQVVSGMNYMLTIRLKEGYKTQICYVKIWSQPWLHRKEMTEHSCSQVTKRAGGLLGGPTGVDVNSAEIQEVANFALTEINGIQGAQNSLVKVVNARKQIVSGINYILILSLQNRDKTQLCEVRVWYQSWTNTKQVTDHHCSAVNKRSAPVLGGVEPAHLSAPMQQAVSFVEDALNGKMNNMFRMVTEKVDHVTQQVVAGMKYSFDLHLVTSSCMNNPDGNGKGITDCPASNSTPQRMTCRVSVLYQAWSDPKFQLLSDTCGQLA
ncbi:multicystatin-like isoform X2 [Haliotis rubra]|uniref:multicystatin-like isoform X2 n=1 Tax=Haliotis rubra TaxID=36100 RepID=UPI001EE591F1|nr:multicystatin-like isoform X2 [Haliotis rubra]